MTLLALCEELLFFLGRTINDSRRLGMPPARWRAHTHEGPRRCRSPGAFRRLQANAQPSRLGSPAGVSGSTAGAAGAAGALACR